MTIGQVCADLIRHPLRHVVYRWHWKSAFCSASVRGTLFFVTNVSGGHVAAVRAMLIESAVRVLVVGMLAAVTQAFRYADPPWVASCFATAALPILALAADFLVHRVLATPELAASMRASIGLSALSTLFSLFVMRQGVMVVDDSRRPFREDLRQLPRLIVEFVWVLPRTIARHRGQLPLKHRSASRAACRRGEMLRTRAHLLQSLRDAR